MKRESVNIKNISNTNMIRLIAVFFTLYLADLCYEVRSEDAINQFIKDHNDINTVDGLHCSQLEGTNNDCLACYSCDHNKIKATPKEKQRNLVFAFSDCKRKDKLCCIRTNDLRPRTNDDNCGKRNINGNPRRSRPTLRAVLEREYPWRAWVYRSHIEKPLCAATYIFFGVNGLLTTASCLSGYKPSDLVVRFTKNQKVADTVTRIHIHENFLKSNKSDGNTDDIALLTISKKPSSLVHSVCLDKDPPIVGSSCVLVSEKETYINTIIPSMSQCQKTNVSAINGVICSYLLKGDLNPENGAGLYCLNEHSQKPTYTLHGIFQKDQSDANRNVYTSVHKYNNWVLQASNYIKKLDRLQRNDN